jgi:non-canonical (house-cleaning) NTP pyrophosphatase
MKYLLPVVLALSGCAMPIAQRPPPSVQAMPNDCANRVAIIEWLNSQSQVPRQPFENQETYENARSEIRSRIWHMRYRCQPV